MIYFIGIINITLVLILIKKVLTLENLTKKIKLH